MLDPHELRIPIVGAPMAGGPSTAALAAAVSQAGGLGFLAAGYKPVDAVAAEIDAVRERTSEPFGTNVFSPPEVQAPESAVADYARGLAADAERYGVALGPPGFDDDYYVGKLELMAGARVPVVSFTFGTPRPESVAALHERGCAVWVTVTSPHEAAIALAAGADALVAQGTEAGGHRGFFRDDADHEEYGLVVLLRLLAAETDVPVIAAGGIMDGPGIAAALCAGAAAAQLGSALMLTPEAGTSIPHRDRLTRPAPTRLTRAFSGRTARGIVNRFMDEHDADAPAAYPQVHHLTTPIRAAARQAGDPEAVNLWAGQGHALARDAPAGALVAELAASAARTLADLARRFPA
ncbi:MAG TPA: nitronate monooxygenase [Solirubrobacteraceae bacterium]|nr:nitronate monooxygenase [Solirubrobacteraceae bacterium]